MFKLKIFIFPLVLLVSVMWISTKTWPELSRLLQARADITVEEQKVQEMIGRKENVGSLLAAVTNNPEKERLVLAFYPNKKQEEVILNQLYAIATESRLSVLDIAWEGVEDLNKEIELVDPASMPQVLDEFGNAIDPAMLGEAEIVTPALHVEAVFAGTYGEIRAFLDMLYRLERMNFISSVEIRRSSETSSPPEDIIPTDAEEGSIAPVTRSAVTETLVVSVSAYFPFSSQQGASTTANAAVFFRKEFDFSIVDKLSKIVQVVPTAVGQTGRDNPFLP